MANFSIIKQSEKSQARIGELETAHGKIRTPVFMPVGTLGSVKGVSPDELRELGAEIILGNTYHLYLRPGEKLIKKFGGLSKFNGWKGPTLTDSGGFQIFSLGKFANSKSALRQAQIALSSTPRSLRLEESQSKGEILNSRQTQNPKFKIQNDYESQVTNYELQGSSLVKITEKGAEFRSHLDGSKHFFTPEKVIDIQLDLGSDIIMVLDVCTEYPATRKRAEETMKITHLWAKRSIMHFRKKMQKFQVPRNKLQINSKSQIPKSKTNYELRITSYKKRSLLFGIVQGSTYKDLRTKSAKYISSLGFDGIAVGGVSVGEGKGNMQKVMKWVSPYLPEDLPHYLMGIGEPEDIMNAVKYGFDMFDCVLPTRLARHGVVWTKSGTRNPSLEHTRDKKFETNSKNKFQKIDLRKSKYREDKNSIDKNCGCYACRNKFTKAYISHLIKNHEMLGFRLASIHNLHFIINLVEKIRAEIRSENDK